MSPLKNTLVISISQMEDIMTKRIAELLKKCMENEISFEYSGNVEQIYITKIINGEWSLYECEYTCGTYGKTKDEAVERLHELVDRYLEKVKNEGGKHE